MPAIASRGTVINLRASVAQRALIDKAAQVQGKSRTDFMLDAAWVMTVTAYPDIDIMRPNVMDMKYFLSTATDDRDIWLA